MSEFGKRVLEAMFSKSMLVSYALWGFFVFRFKITMLDWEFWAFLILMSTLRIFEYQEGFHAGRRVADKFVKDVTEIVNKADREKPRS